MGDMVDALMAVLPTAPVPTVETPMEASPVEDTEDALASLASEVMEDLPLLTAAREAPTAETPLETGMITPRLVPTVASNTPTCTVTTRPTVATVTVVTVAGVVPTEPTVLTVTPPVTVRLVPSPTLERPDLTATRWTRKPPRDPLLPRVATTTMPGPSRPTVL